MTNDGGSVNSQQQGPSVFVVIILFVDVLHDFFELQGQPPMAFQFVLDGPEDHVDQALGRFQDDIADKSFADHNVVIALENVTAFEVSGKIDACVGLQKGPGFFDQFISLGVLFANVHQSYTGILDSEHFFGVDTGHYSILI